MWNTLCNGTERMAESAVVAELEEVFLCPVCLEHVSQPRMLTCQHTFCLGCIQRVYNEAVSVQPSTKDIKCPMCKAVTSLPGGSVSDLPVDFRANQVRSILEKLHTDKENEESDQVDSIPGQPGVERSFPTTCYLCSKGGYNVDATVLCIDCGKIFCVTCHSHHEERFQNHLYSSVKTDDIKSLVCQEHGEFIQTFCLDCKKGICQSCSQITHSRHEISDFVKSGTASGVSIISTIDDKQVQLGRTLIQMSIAQEDENNELARMKTCIRERKEQLIKELEQKELEQLEKIENTAADRRKLWNDARQTIHSSNDKLLRYKDSYAVMENPVPELSDVSLNKLTSSKSIIDDVKGISFDMPLEPQFEINYASDSVGDSLDLGSFLMRLPAVRPMDMMEPEAEALAFEQNPQRPRRKFNSNVDVSEPVVKDVERHERDREPRGWGLSSLWGNKGERRNGDRRDHKHDKGRRGKKGNRGRNFRYTDYDDGYVEQVPARSEDGTRDGGSGKHDRKHPDDYPARRYQENGNAHSHEGRRRDDRNQDRKGLAGAAMSVLTGWGGYRKADPRDKQRRGGQPSGDWGSRNGNEGDWGGFGNPDSGDRQKRGGHPSEDWG